MCALRAPGSLLCHMLVTQNGSGPPGGKCGREKADQECEHTAGIGQHSSQGPASPVQVALSRLGLTQGHGVSALPSLLGSTLQQILTPGNTR